MGESFGVVLRDLRHAARWTQQALAAELRVDPTYLSHVENGRGRPGHAFIRRAATALAPEEPAVERRLMVLAGHLPENMNAAAVNDAVFAARVWELWETYCAERRADAPAEDSLQAKGDGITDDTKAIQAALDRGSWTPQERRKARITHVGEIIIQGWQMEGGDCPSTEINTRTGHTRVGGYTLDELCAMDGPKRFMNNRISYDVQDEEEEE